MNGRVGRHWAPAVVPDLRWNELFSNRASGTTWALGSLSRDSYMAVPENAKALVDASVARMDGMHSIAAIVDEVSPPGTRVDIGGLTCKLRSANLLADQESSERPPNEFTALAWRIARWKIDGSNWLLQGLARLLLPLIALSLLIVIWALVSGAFARELRVTGYMAFAGSNLMRWGILLGVCVLSVTLHELGHAVVARYFGLRPSAVTISLYLYFSPIVYISIPGLYSISPRRRVLVWAAGPWVNVVLAALGATFGLHAAGTMEMLCEATVLVNLLLAGVNLYPFLPLDGYFMASTLLGVTNLRAHALRLQPRNRRVLSPAARVALLVYTLATWGTVIALLARELWGIGVTIVQAANRHLGLLGTLDALKGYLLLAGIIVTTLVARRYKLSG